MVTLTNHVIPGPDLHCALHLVLLQNPLISPGLCISIGWQNRIKGAPGILVVNIIGNYCCTRVLLYSKMLKPENEETRLFRQIFIIGGIYV